MTDLLELAERVEAGEYVANGQETLSIEISNQKALQLSSNYIDVIFSALDGSLDAAKALHDAVLPEWYVETMCHQHTPIIYRDDISQEGPWLVELQHIKGGRLCGSEAPTPAVAWVAAILRAKASIDD